MYTEYVIYGILGEYECVTLGSSQTQFKIVYVQEDYNYCEVP